MTDSLSFKLSVILVLNLDSNLSSIDLYNDYEWFGNKQNR